MIPPWVGSKAKDRWVAVLKGEIRRALTHGTWARFQPHGMVQPLITIPADRIRAIASSFSATPLGSKHCFLDLFYAL